MSELEPTATERLRALLDERGVGHEDDEDVTRFFGPDGFEVVMQEDIDGKLDCLTPLYLTPEQAVEATLGRGTCRNIAPAYLDFLCSECGFVHYHSDANDTGDGNEWHFCPNCGRLIEVDDG